MNKIIASLIFISTLVLVRPALAAEPVDVFYFYDQECSSCQTMADALHALNAKYPEMKLIALYVSSGQDNNQTIFYDLLTLYQRQSRSIPTVIVGAGFYEGYSATIVNEIEQTVVQCRTYTCTSPRQLLSQYYDSLAQTSANPINSKSTWFWTIFIFAWPLLGVVSIIWVVKKYK